MSSVNIDHISQVITRLNEIIKTPVCSSELTRLSKLIKEVDNINTQFEEAGRLQKRGLKKSLEDIVKLMAPIAPHISEEMWHMLGHKSFVSTEQMPSFDKSAVNEEVEQQEDFIKQVISDVLEIQKIVKIKPKKVSLFMADDWKFSVYNTILKNKEKGINEITKEIMSTGKYGKATIGFIQSLYMNFCWGFSLYINLL